LGYDRVLLHYFQDIGTDDNLSICCLYHEESVPSLRINTETGFFYCFGCGAKGDIYDLIAKIDGINRLQAMLKAYRINGGTVKFSKSERTSRKDSADWLDKAKRDYNSCIKPNWNHVRDHYMLDRGFESKTLTEFDIRLDPFSHHPVVMPLYQNKRLKGVVRRRIDKEDEGKYLFNKGFRRKSALIGKYRKYKPILVTEGFLDMMKAQQGGFKDYCCLLGWKASDYQIRRLKRYTNTIISALDNTPTGRKGTKLLKQHFNVIRFDFPDYCKDLGDMSAKQIAYSRSNIRRQL
jgi:DNA primase